MHPFELNSLVGKKNLFIVLRAAEYVQNLDNVSGNPIEDQLVPIGSSPCAAVFVPGNQCERFRHCAKFMAARLELGHECLGPLRIIGLDVPADCDEIGDGRLGQDDDH